MRKKFEVVLKELRIRENLTPEELALRLDLPLDVYEQIEAGKMVPDGETFERLTDLFGVSYDYLLTGEPVNETWQKAMNEITARLIHRSPEEIRDFLDYIEAEVEKKSTKPFYKRG